MEVHVQPRTRSKMFCGCATDHVGQPPNSVVCEICLGMPGVLPVINKQAVELCLRAALALNCEIPRHTKFDRKNYFYPDLPKGYQISQYDQPLCRGGHLGDVRIHRVHMEEDAAKLVHIGRSGRIHGSDASVVDFNRGGTPLVEVVSEPDLRAPAQAREWLELLAVTLRRLDVSDVRMEEGSLRCDANVSVRQAGSEALGVKTELKNMNSFRFIERGIEAEIERQSAILEAGGEVEQETLHFDPRTGELTPLRSKEEAHDYRYFPEPDLIPVDVTEEMIAAARSALPELPAARAERFQDELGLHPDTARVLAFRLELGDYFEAALDADGAEAQPLANWVVNELVGQLEDADPAESNVAPEALARLVAMVEGKEVTAGAAKQVLARLVAEGGDPAAIIEAQDLAAIGGDDGELAEIVARAIEADPDAADKVRGGNAKAIGALVGAVMRETKGRADGGEVTRLIREQLSL